MIIAHSFLEHRSPKIRSGPSHSKDIAETPASEKVDVTFESAIKEAAAFAARSAITHIPCAVYPRSTATERDSKRAIVGSTESQDSQQLYPTAVDSHGQTGLSSSVSSCEDFAKNFKKRRGYIYSNGIYYKTQHQQSNGATTVQNSS